MVGIRRSIEEGQFETFRRAFLSEYLSEDRKEELELGGSRVEMDDLSWNTEHSVIPTND